MTIKDPNLTVDDLGTVLVSGGSGFVGSNFVKTLLDRGLKVKSFDIVPSPLDAHENLEVIEGNICDINTVEKACEGVDTIFHTAAMIGLKSGKSITPEFREQSYAINVQGTKNLLNALQKAGGKRFVYTASNSVVIGGKPLKLAKEDTPYTNRFNDLYTETKVVAEKWVLQQNGVNGVLTCSCRPSGIWGPGDQTMFRLMFEQVQAGILISRVGDGSERLDNSFVHNLIHGEILAAQHLVEGGTAPGQAYFINDGDELNMFDFAKPLLASLGHKMPDFSLPYWLVRTCMVIWENIQAVFTFLPPPPLPPLAIERVGVTNTFSIEKARQDLGYEPPYTTEEAMKLSEPFYQQLYQDIKAERAK